MANIISDETIEYVVHGHADYFRPYFAVFVGYSRSCVEPSCAQGYFKKVR